MFLGGLGSYFGRSSHNKAERERRMFQQMNMRPDRAQARVPGVHGPMVRPVNMEQIAANPASYTRLTEQGQPTAQLSPEMMALLANWRIG
jgi:hypothetical protein